MVDVLDTHKATRCLQVIVTYWGRDKLVGILQTTFSN